MSKKPPSARPSWDQYFLNIAFCISSRSDDEFIKHGAVLVDNKSKHIIGTGYNNTVRGFDLKDIDVWNRDERRPLMAHAEKNCILNTLINPHHLFLGATMYITGMPCPDCLMDIVNFGVNQIVVADRQAHIGATSPDVMERERIILKNSRLKVVKIPAVPLNVAKPANTDGINLKNNGAIATNYDGLGVY